MLLLLCSVARGQKLGIVGGAFEIPLSVHSGIYTQPEDQYLPAAEARFPIFGIGINYTFTFLRDSNAFALGGMVGAELQLASYTIYENDRQSYMAGSVPFFLTARYGAGSIRQAHQLFGVGAGVGIYPTYIGINSSNVPHHSFVPPAAMVEGTVKLSSKLRLRLRYTYVAGEATSTGTSLSSYQFPHTLALVLVGAF